jgi:hypothetical protein
LREASSSIPKMGRRKKSKNVIKKKIMRLIQRLKKRKNGRRKRKYKKKLSFSIRR